MMLDALSPAARRAVTFWAGVSLVAALILAPALPIPGLAAPPLPLAALWAAYGWAAHAQSGWRAPALLGLFGIGHDLLAGGPAGLYPLVYVGAYGAALLVVIGVRPRTFYAEWGGMIATLALTTLLAGWAAPWALDGRFPLVPWAWAILTTAVLYPFVRPLFMVETIG